MTSRTTSGSAPLRAMVFGVGHLGKEHARIYRQMNDVELVGVIDPDAKALRKISRQQKCPGFSPGEELPEFDLASVVVPTFLHHEIAAPLLDRGISCLIEKPIATDLEQARDLVERASRSGAVLSVGHIERFNPALRAARDRALEPKFIEVHRISPFSFRSADVGVVLDLMIHDLDVVLALVRRPVVDVRAVGAAFIGEHEDIANARLEFEGGCVANVTASRAALKVERKFRLFSSSGSYLSMDFAGRKAMLVRKNRDLTPEALGLDPSSPKDLRKLAGKIAFGDFLDVEHLDMDEGEPLRLELEAFVASCRGAAPVVTGEDGTEALELAMRILERIREHSWSGVPDG